VLKKTYTTFNPATLVDKWNTLYSYFLRKDFRVPIGQAESQAAQLLGIKVGSRLLKKTTGIKTAKRTVCT
jgi:hypothetical protein